MISRNELKSVMIFSDFMACSIVVDTKIFYLFCREPTLGCSFLLHCDSGAMYFVGSLRCSGAATGV